MQNTNKGYTLLEISIVLIIVGLVTGVVVLGRDLIRSAEIRATAHQIEELDTAIAAFYLKYGCLPGDCPNASAFGFQDSTLIISSNEPEADFWDHINPVAYAHAFTLHELSVQLSLLTCYNLVNVATGQTASNCGDHAQQVVNMRADGNGNGLIDEQEFLGVASILVEAGFMKPFDPVSGVIKTKDSGIYSPVTNQPGALIVSSVQPIPPYTLARDTGLYYYISGTVITGQDGVAATAATPVYTAFSFDTKFDNGLPADGRTASSLNQRLFTQSGLFFFPEQLLPASANNFDCVGMDSSNKPVYNLLNDKARCAIQFRSQLF